MDLEVYTCSVYVSVLCKQFTCLCSCECMGMHINNCKGILKLCTQVGDKCYLEADALLLSFLGFRGAGGGAVQGAAAASSRTELAAFPEHLRLALGALWGNK